MTNPTKCWCGGTVSEYRLSNDEGPFATEWRCDDSAYHDPTATGAPTEITTIYVAGPMSGYPDNNYPEFNRVAKALREIGYTVVNPAEFGNGRHYVDFLREDLRLMLDCHAVATLENWWESTGARNEVNVAGLLKMPVRSYVEWLERPGLGTLNVNQKGA